MSDCFQACKKVAKDFQFLMGVVQSSKGKHGSKLGKPAALHVCGGPAAGKTMGVTDCKRQMIAWAKDNLEAWQEMPVFCHIRGSLFQRHCTSKSAAMKGAIAPQRVQLAFPTKLSKHLTRIGC
jgi:hypothetical protein